MMRRRFLVAIAALLAGAATAADAPRTTHGSSDIFAAPGVALAWGVLRGPDEARTTVVVRVAADPATYTSLAVVGIDPFSKAETIVLAATPNAGVLDVRMPRARFADYPHTELRFFKAAAAPALIVFYHGVPDTTPEFTDAAKLDAHLAARIAQARAGPAK